jgi:hypothetical protein
LLQFSINYGTNADKNNNRLTTYDSNSILDNLFINLSYFNETKLSLTNFIITVYSIIDTKKESSLTLKLSKTVFYRKLQIQSSFIVGLFLMIRLRALLS